MRDPKRIEECLYYIQKIWETQPDIRFNQLMMSLQTQFSDDNNQEYSHHAWQQHSEHTMTKNEYIDLFYVEDDVFIEWLKKRVK